MRFSLILIGFLFIFSPDIALFDFLPDVIGWFLIFVGLTPLADIELRAGDAKALSLRMMLFSAVKLVLSLFTFRFGTADMLLATFSYGIVEVITVIPFTTNLFTALDYSAMRITPSLNSDKVNAVKWYIYVFFVIKSLLAFLPATTALFDTKSTGNLSADTWFVDFEAAMRVFMVFAFMLSALIFIASIVFVGDFFIKLIKNKELRENMIKHRKEEVLSKPEIMTVKNTSFALSFFMGAILFFFDFYIDTFDLLPTFVGFLLIFIASVFIAKNMEVKTLSLSLVSFLGFAVSLLAFIYRFYWGKLTGFDLTYVFNLKAYTLPLGILNFLLTSLTLILLFRAAKSFNKKYTKDPLEDNVVLFVIGAVIEAFFGFVLYAFPKFNTTFVFPSIVFGVVYLSLTINYFIKLKKQISKDLK